MKGCVPGNVLLVGEYAVLEENGLGLTAAVKPLVSWKHTAGSGISGSWAGHTEKFDPAAGGTDGSGLFSHCWTICRKYMEHNNRSGKPSITAFAGGIHIDSNAFFAGRRKKGFGSSAAAAVACVRAILDLTGSDRADEGLVGELAYKAHSSFQGKAGSGYDVFTSVSGGTNLFTGGSRSCRRINLSWMGNPGSGEMTANLCGLFFKSGPGAVSTSNAVHAYFRWKEKNTAAAKRFVEENNDIVHALAGASGWSEAKKHIERAAELSAWLGNETGYPASVPPVPSLRSIDSTVKTSGAGDELYLIFAVRDPDDPAVHPIEVYRGDE